MARHDDGRGGPPKRPRGDAGHSGQPHDRDQRPSGPSRPGAGPRREARPWDASRPDRWEGPPRDQHGRPPAGPSFQPVYVGDVADAFDRILEAPETAGQTYELGGPTVYSFRELMEILLREIGRNRLLLPMPFFAASIQGGVFEMLPVPPPLTRDQVRLLRHDNVVDPTAHGFASLGIEPEGLAAILPTYLRRYRRGGRA